MSDYKFWASWNLYTPDGIQMTFFAGDDDMAAQLQNLGIYLTHLRDRGFMAQMPGLEDGEKIEEVDAYVVGETSKGDSCIYLYAANHGLQFRLATVYVEKFPELPFEVKGKKWDASAAPQREEAEKKGYLVQVHPLKIVMEPKGTTDDGKPRWAFARVFGAKPAAAPTEAAGKGASATHMGTPPTHAAPPSAAQAAANGNGKAHATAPAPSASAADFDAMTSASDTTQATEAQRKTIFTLANKLYGKDHAEEQFRPWLKTNYKVESTKSLTIAQASQVIDLLNASINEAR